MTSSKALIAVAVSPAPSAEKPRRRAIRKASCGVRLGTASASRRRASASSYLPALAASCAACEGVELGDKVISIAAVVGLGEFDGPAVAQVAQALDEQPGIALAGLQQLGLLGVEQQGMQ